jgi:hypothetical protein
MRGMTIGSPHQQEALMAQQRSWGTIDFEAPNAVDPEYMFSYGAINSKGVAMHELRPTVIAAQAAMKAGYSAAFEAARGKPGAAEVYARIAALPEKVGKVRQPGGEQLDLIGLYKGALGAVGEVSCGRTGSRRSSRAARRAWRRRGASRRCGELPSFLSPNSYSPKAPATQ